MKNNIIWKNFLIFESFVLLEKKGEIDLLFIRL